MGTFLLLLVLAGWIAVGLWWFTSHRDAPADAIGSFRRQLGSLERRGPGLVAPAHRFQSGRGHGVGARAGVPAAYRRAAIQKRRRDILSGLALATGGSFLLGFVPALRPMWILSVVAGALLGGYVYLLVQLRNAAAEREIRARFSGAQGDSIGQVAATPVAARRRPDVDLPGYAAYTDDDAALEPALLSRSVNW